MSVSLRRTFGVCVTVLSLIRLNAFAHTVEDMQKLIDDKKINYNNKFRPVFYQSDTVSVSVSMEMVAIQEFNEVTGKFSVVGFLTMSWQDQFLAWNPDDYNNMTEFAAEGGDFWRVSLVLVNPYDKIDVLGHEKDVFRYYADGTVVVMPGDVFESGCIVDVTKYPWDEQTCSLTFSPWGFNGYEVNITRLDERVKTTYYIGNGAWDLVETKSETYQENNGPSFIMFTVRLRRKPLYVLVNVILPVFFMSFLNTLVFLIPTASGERVSYCLTVLLALAVFLTLVGDNLPKTSDPMSLLSYYLLSVLVVSVFIVFATMFSLRVYFRDDRKPIPECLATFARCMGCKCDRDLDFADKYYPSRDRRANVMLADGRPPRYRNGRDGSVFATNDLPIAYRNRGPRRKDNIIGSYGHMSSFSKKQSHVSWSDSEETKVYWKDVSIALDKVFFWVFFCSEVVFTVVFFAIIFDKID